MVYGLSIVCTLVAIVCFALLKSIDAPTDHLDGAFQTASGLYRLKAGQLPGRDFFSYLGAGPLLTLFPLFAAAGGDLAASTFSARCVISILTLLSSGLILRLISHRISLLAAIVIWTVIWVLLLGSTYAFLGYFPRWVVFGFFPGNSLRPLRAMVPYLATGLLLVVLRFSRRTRRTGFLAGCISGASVMWSNDFGLPTALVTSILYFLGSTVVRRSAPWLHILGLVSSFVLVGCTITAGYFFPLLRYNFVDVAQNQWWLFGPYDDASRIYSLTDLFVLLAPGQALLPAIVLCFTVWKAWRSSDLSMTGVAGIGSALFLGGVTASVGGHVDEYFGAFQLWATLVVGSFLISSSNTLFSSCRHAHLSRSGPALTAVAFFLIAVLSVFFLHRARSFAASDPSRVYVTELGAYLPAKWSANILAAREARGLVTLEEYWGVFSAIQGRLPLSRVDSAIHALGSAQEPFLRSLEMAEVVITTRPSFSPRWQPWSFSANYWLYRGVMSEFSPLETFDSTVLWRRRPMAGSEARLPRTKYQLQYNSEARVLTGRGGKPGLYEVSLDYTVQSKSRCLVLVSNGLNQACHPTGYTSIPSKGGLVRFPVHVGQDVSIRLPLLTPSPGQIQLVFTEAFAVYLTNAFPQVYTQMVGDGQ